MNTNLVKKLRQHRDDVFNGRRLDIAWVVIDCEKAANLIEQQQNEIEQLNKENFWLTHDNSNNNQWRSVNDCLPDMFVSVLGHMDDAGDFPAVRECYAVGDSKLFYFPALCEMHPVSHWMPMPQFKMEDADNA